MPGGKRVLNTTKTENKTMSEYFLMRNSKVGQIFSLPSTFRWIFRRSKNVTPRSRNVFYKITAKFGWLVKAERYHPNRKPQGRDHYGYENLQVPVLRQDKMFRRRLLEQVNMQ